MTDYTLIIIAVVLIIAAVIAFKILASIIKTLVTVAVLAAILAGLGGFLIVTDARDLSENFASQPSLFLVTEGSEAITGVEINGTGEPAIVDEQQLLAYSEDLEAGNYRKIRGDYYKLFLIDQSLLEGESEDQSGGDPESLESSVQGILSDPVYLIAEYKKGSIRIYDETPVFRAVRMLPTSLVRSSVDSLASKAKDAVSEKVEELG